MKILKVLAIGLFAVALAACTTGGPKQTGGTLVGAGLGALAGSQIGSGSGQLAAVAIGTLLGAWLGSEVGASLDKADQLYAEKAAQNSLEYSPSGSTSNWQNPDSGHSGSFTPYAAYQSQDVYCREFTQTITVEDKTEEATGTACRQEDGSWQIVKSGTAG